MIEQAFRGLLAANTGLSALVGAKIYPLVVPQNTAYPAVVYQVISKIPNSEPCQGEQHSENVQQARMQVSIYAEKYEQIVAIDEAIRSALDYYKGTVGTVQISSLRFLSARDLYAQEALVYHRAIDYRIIYSKTIN